MSATKPEFPPLLPLGFRTMTLAELRDMCVARFAPLSQTRGPIMANLETVDNEVRRCGLSCEVWVDGSFLTEAINPADADVLLCIDNATLLVATARQRSVFDWIRANLRRSLRIDSYVLVDNQDDVSTWLRAYWLRQFGFSRRDVPKGIAVLRHS
jgi:hypothetical protein